MAPESRLLSRTPAALALAALLAVAPTARPAGEAAPSRDAQVKAAIEALHKAQIEGPTDVALNDEARLALPEGFRFVPKAQSETLLRLMGNHPDERLIGLVLPASGNGEQWMALLQFEPEGYVKDDDAKHWDADALLKSLKEGTEAGNAERTALGLPALAVTRWIEPPAYDAATHRLVWSAEVTQKDGGGAEAAVNYKTYVLGRDGYVTLNLVTALATVDSDKQYARRLLGEVRYNAGKAYGDFNASTDKVAAYGLAALVAGVAAKKLGLLALLAASAVKFAKVIALAVAGAGAAIAKWFRGRGKRPGAPSA